jgi:agarase
MCALSVAQAQVKVDINLDVKHQVGNVSTFDRSKFITLHAELGENEFKGQEVQMDYLLNGLDTYFGRETGSPTYWLGQVKEHSLYKGYPDLDDMRTTGSKVKRTYDLDFNNRKQYEARQQSLIIGLQTQGAYPGTDRYNWKLNAYTTPFGLPTAQFAANYLAHYFKSNPQDIGRNKPLYFEVMNEPVWPLVDKGFYGGSTIAKIFEMHNTVAKEVKRLNPHVKVGGFTTAFPDFDNNNFNQWDERWKRFIDECGEHMDFYSIHLYEFPSLVGKLKNRRGANVDATLDMIEAYAAREGKSRPIIISEYGASLNDFWPQPWHPWKDWLRMKSFNGLLMQFMERPNTIAKTIPFAPLKAEWGFDYARNQPYEARMMRRANEPESNTGEWVWTEMIRFYQLWSKVNGTRVDTKSEDPNVLVDAYVEGTKVYVILNNLTTENRVIDLKYLGQGNKTLVAATFKHLYAGNQDHPVLQNDTHSLNQRSEFRLKPESTAIIEYSFDSAIEIAQSSQEVKYYAPQLKTPILAEEALTFDFESVAIESTTGEAVLRMGVARDHGKSLKPVVTINGQVITGVYFKGDAQQGRDNFFGILEVEVPYQLLKNGANVVSMKFEEAGGFVSSVALQTFSFSRPVPRFERVLFPDGTYHITSATSDYRLLRRNTDYNVQMHAPGPWDDQEWIFTHVGDNVYTIQNVRNKTYLAVANVACADNANVVGFLKPYHRNRRWKISKQGDVYILKPNHCLTQALDRELGTIKPDANVQTYSVNANNLNQHWKITAVDNANARTTKTGQAQLSAESIIGYPNPVVDWLNLKNVQVGDEIIIRNQSNKVVLRTTLKHRNESLNIKHLKPGVYLLQRGAKTVRLVKQ